MEEKIQLLFTNYRTTILSVIFFLNTKQKCKSCYRKFASETFPEKGSRIISKNETKNLSRRHLPRGTRFLHNAAASISHSHSLRNPILLQLSDSFTPFSKRFLRSTPAESPRNIAEFEPTEVLKACSSFPEQNEVHVARICSKRRMDFHEKRSQLAGKFSRHVMLMVGVRIAVIRRTIGK